MLFRNFLHSLSLFLLFQPWRTRAVRWPVALAAPASSHLMVCPPSACVLWVVRTSPRTWCAAATAWTTKVNVSSTWKPVTLRRTSVCITKAAAVSLLSLYLVISIPFTVIITCSSVTILPFLHCSFLQSDRRSFWLLLECSCGQCWEVLLLKYKGPLLKTYRQAIVYS